MTMIHEMAAQGRWDPGRPGTNLIGTGAPFYDVYKTADGRFVAIGAIEPKFYAALLRATGLEQEDLPAQMDRAGWDTLRQRFTALFRRRTQAEWCRLLEDADCCFAPVLSLADAPRHPHLAARGTFPDGVLPGPAPRFSRTDPQRRPTAAPDGPDALTGWGFGSQDVADLTGAGVVS
jgi:alpha-methylacyl-CoA racemase